MKNKTYCVGDIHGGLRAFDEVFSLSLINKGDTIIFLGDYVDGWSESSELVEKLIDLKKDYNCIFLKGNHDDWCGKWLELGQTPMIWTEQGGKATIESYIKTGYLIEDRHRDFFKKLKLFYVDEDNKAFVHGGFIDNFGLGRDFDGDYYWDRSLWDIALSGRKSQSPPKKLLNYKEIFIGHTSTVNWSTDKPMNACNVWNLDTGGGWYGKLTIMDVDTKEYWQSSLVKDLYPEERGRG